MVSARKWVMLISVGEYSDTRIWPLLICDDEAAATRAIEAAEARRQAIVAELSERYDGDIYAPPDDVTLAWFQEFATTWSYGLFSDYESVRFEAVECAAGEWPAKGEERTDGR